MASTTHKQENKILCTRRGGGEVEQHYDRFAGSMEGKGARGELPTSLDTRDMIRKPSTSTSSSTINVTFVERASDTPAIHPRTCAKQKRAP